MPSAKRKFAEIEKERAEIRKTNHSISSFFGAKERYDKIYSHLLRIDFKCVSPLQFNIYIKGGD
jgi:hypothetical protein